MREWSPGSTFIALDVNGSEGGKAGIRCIGEVTSNGGDDEDVAIERSEYEVNDEGRYGGEVEHELRRRLKLSAYELWCEKRCINILKKQNT
jgi:hypothetical protein